MLEYSNGESKKVTELWDMTAAATRDVVRRQVAVGLDVINDGEYGKASYAGYVKERLTGFAGDPRYPGRSPASAKDEAEFPDWERQHISPFVFPVNTGPVALRDASAVRRDIANLKSATAGLDVAGVFMTAASPGVIQYFMPTTFYTSDKDYLRALAYAMRDEYRAIVEAGFILQIDCPDLAMTRHSLGDLTLEEFRQVSRLHIAVLNEVLQGLPRERVRLHVCWGNYAGPHFHDVPLRDIIDVVLEARVGAISFEAANPRHAHEWQVFKDVDVPDGMLLIPGVIDTCTNYVEHPELVAERLLNFASVVGRDNLIAGCDCGFGTMLGPRPVAASVAWAKLASLVEGAKIASHELWGAAGAPAIEIAPE
jgi:5-methyltetrahydropteroyltriglutamate--homocysteine methyltransferase